jgi:hypothetical protein
MPSPADRASNNTLTSNNTIHVDAGCFDDHPSRGNEVWCDLLPYLEAFGVTPSMFRCGFTAHSPILIFRVDVNLYESARERGDIEALHNHTTSVTVPGGVFKSQTTRTVTGFDGVLTQISEAIDKALVNR